MCSTLYNVTVKISELPADRWEVLRGRCAGQIGSLIELLQGRLSDGAMAVVTDRAEGLFPQPKEIKLHCDCPDWANMCKHVAAVLYGVGVRLDDHPELLFLLRGVNHDDLITSEVGALAAATGSGKGSRRRIADDDLADIFGIDVEEQARELVSPVPPKRTREKTAKAAAKAAAAKEAKEAKEAAAKAAKKAKAKEAREAARKAKAAAKKAAAKAAKAAAKEAKAAAEAAEKAAKEAAKEAAKKAKAAASLKSVHGPGTNRVTGGTVAALRREFGMSPKQFARLLGTSTPTVGNWERTPGPLKMQERTAAAWSRVARMTTKEAWRMLGER